jgi:hypothetical protein
VIAAVVDAIEDFALQLRYEVEGVDLAVVVHVVSGDAAAAHVAELATNAKSKDPVSTVARRHVGVLGGRRDVWNGPPPRGITGAVRAGVLGHVVVVSALEARRAVVAAARQLLRVAAALSEAVVRLLAVLHALAVGRRRRRRLLDLHVHFEGYGLGLGFGLTIELDAQACGIAVLAEDIEAEVAP